MRISLPTRLLARQSSLVLAQPTLEGAIEDFAAYRQADIRFHEFVLEHSSQKITRIKIILDNQDRGHKSRHMR